MAMLLGSTAVAGMIAPSARAQAQAGEAAFDIPAQSLAGALDAFSRVSGISVTYGSALPDVGSPGVTGRMSPAEALSRLLAGTGLTYRFTGADTVTLEPVPQTSDGTVRLGTLRVEGAAGNDGGRAASGGAAQGPGGAPDHRNYRTAGSTAYRGEEAIQRMRGTSPGDFLSGIPGVLNGDNRNSGALDVNIRGMQGMDRVPVVIDGSLQQSTVYRGYSGVAGRTYLDPDLIGSVTIEKGPSASADGVGATGGVVRAQTIGAKDLIAPGGTFGIRARAGLNGNNVDPPAVETLGTGNGTEERFDRPGLLDLNGYNFSLAAAGRIADFELVAAFARRKTGNYFGGDHGTVPEEGSGINGIVLRRYNLGEEVLATSQDNTSALLRGTYRFGNGMGLDLSYIRYESDFGELMPSQIIRFGGAMQPPLSRAEVDTYTARYRWNPADNDLIEFKADLWATSSYTSIETLYRWDFGGNVTVGDAAYQSQSDRWGVTLSNTSRLDLPIGALELDYGGSYTRERIMPPDGWEEYKENSGYADFVEPRDGWRNEYSGFIAAQFKPAPWVSFDAALRYTDTVSHDNNLVDISVGDGERATGYNHEHNTGFAPIFAFLVEPLPGLQFYGRYAEAIRNPSLFESTTGFSFRPDPRNPIVPERARTTEFGVNLQRTSLIAENDLFEAKLAYFTNDIDDYLTRGSSDGMTSVINIDSARFQGLEASARYDSGSVFAEIGGAYYTFMEFCAEDNLCRKGGTPNSYIPAHLPPETSLSAHAGVRLFDERLVLGGRYTHVGERDAAIVSWGGSLTVVDWQPYDVFDLYGSFDLNEYLRLDIAVDNVTDRYYMDALTLGLMPSPGRTLRFGITSSFGGPERGTSLGGRLAAAERLGDNTLFGGFDGDWSGPYVGLQAGYGLIGTQGETTATDGTAGGIPATESADASVNASWIGGYAGYTVPVGGAWFAGGELSFDISRGRTRQYAVSTELEMSYECGTLGVCDLRNQADTEYRFNWYGTARARLGYSTGRVLLYGAGGLAFLNERQTRTQYRDTIHLDEDGIGQNVTPEEPYGDLSEPWFSESDTNTRIGWTLAGGAEVAIGNNWSLRAEYAYARFGRQSFDFNDARAGVGKSFLYREVVGTEWGTIPGFEELGPIFQIPIYEFTDVEGTSDIVNGRRARNRADMHSLRVGVSFRF
ncbi:TonB-dependent receptor domain-containing protein [Stakelama tenebrarum]|uniref:TonB-dependent receptor n=1 Tax=Stakelama tenebrarum TaxID=2711215 RepID=A0A6G6Y2D8_9SPHN|nr:TonB-dependent receptor [Sphingosinithalassobacter tenebrarum]QIG79070.1 TonB-dependent receptor [Sphingosinithalassobacter tenebrarum]